MTTAIDVDDFPAFFEAVRGRPPFTWQRRFVTQVVEQGRWPDLVDLPTGAGKTSLLDIAVFALALDAAHGTGLAPRRTVLVVDRRIVVDQAATAAGVLCDALTDPEAHAADPRQRDLLHAVGDALRLLSGDGPPLVVGTLRGAIVRDETWARRPDVPALLSSTVDQVGSRLLFRGYGIREEMRPIHAGLLGTDTLILLDEVHLSQPFAQTLRAIAARHQHDGEIDLPSRWQVVELSATPSAAAPVTYTLRPEDLEGADAAPHDRVLRQRLEASKPTDLRAVVGRGVDRRPLASAAAAAARELLQRPEVRRVGVVVNRVETAHDVSEQLGTEAVLLTGRMRPLERDALVHELLPQLATGRARSDEDRPLVVVGTQCIEAGADFDFDALVSECASLDALRQRFGRLDRAGALATAGTPARGIVLALDRDIEPVAEDPVYGDRLAATWQWLSAGQHARSTAHDEGGSLPPSTPVVDLGVAHLQLPDGDELHRLLAPRPDAPHLFPGHLDAWVQTWPAPHADPDPALWLHGLRPTATDVSVVWRCDVTETTLRSALEADRGTGDAREQLLALVAACPPAAVEAAPVPLPAVRRWLASEVVVGDTFDVEAAAPQAPFEADASTEGRRPFLLWRGDRSLVEEQGGAIRPGDVVVVPSGYGGLAHGSWHPATRLPVRDLGDEAQLASRRRLALRLLPPLWPDVDVPRPSVLDDAGELDRRDDRHVVLEWLRGLAVREAPINEPQRSIVAHMVDAAGPRTSARRFEVIRIVGPAYGDDGSATAEYYVCSCYVVDRSKRTVRERVPDADSDPDASAFTGVAGRVPLAAHLDGVGRWARALALRVGLHEHLAGDLELAARLHDLGKLDPRFQLLLHGGDRLAAAAAGEPLAKSGTAPNDRVRRRRAYERSGYPKRMRHELLSVALVHDRREVAARAHDWDLVLHLVASHHGYGRPFVPVVLDPEPQDVAWTWDGIEVSGSSHHGLERVDSGIPERFWRLVRRYGAFRLAWLEALLRLADHNRSAEEQED